jgi:hypothetical protein
MNRSSRRRASEATRIGLVGSAVRRLRRCGRSWLGPLIRQERGQELAEAAIILPILLIMAFAVIEFGNAYSIVHTMAGLSREGANLAARGTSLDTTLQIVLTNGSDISLSAQGGTVVTRVQVQSGTPVVIGQVASPGYSGLSRIGTVGNPAQDVGSWGLQAGQDVYAVEIFYRYDQLTPLGNIIGPAVPDTLYERTVF